MEESRGAKAANDSHFSRRRRWRLEYLAGNGCVVFPRLLGWVSTIVNGPTQHRRDRLDTAFSYEKAYETILTLTLTKQALRTRRPGGRLSSGAASRTSTPRWSNATARGWAPSSAASLRRRPPLASGGTTDAAGDPRTPGAGSTMRRDANGRRASRSEPRAPGPSPAAAVAEDCCRSAHSGPMFVRRNWSSYTYRTLWRGFA